jgi:transglutaminase-like putative cysteine protease
MLLQEKTNALTLRLGCRFRFESQQPVSSIFLVRPDSDGPHRVVAERWETEPHVPYHDYFDVYGNLCRRTTLPAGAYELRYDALVEAPAEADPSAPYARELVPSELPDEVLLYTLPSRYCPSDALAYRASELFGHLEPGWSRVQAVCDWVHQRVEFGYGTTTPATSAAEVLENGRGVCRDFTHLAVTFCRALNVPARYACGYIPDIDVPPPDAPMDFCAWFEAYLGGQWWTFDPRNNQRRRGRVAIARGRDAADVAMATTYGASTLAAMEVWADQVRP